MGLQAKAQTNSQSTRYNYFFLEAIRQQEMGNFAAAFDLLRHALDINPNAPEVYYEIAGYYIDMQNGKAARYYFEKAAELAPDNPAYLEKLGQFYISQANYEQALAAYERLYANNKTREDVLQILYQLYGSQNNYKKMIEVIERMEMLLGSSEQLSLTKMQIFEQMGDKRKAQAELMRLVQKNPLDLNYRIMLGNWFFQNDKKKEAFKEYQAVLKEEPNNAAAQLSLLDYYRDAKNAKVVEELTQKLLESKKTEKETKMALLRQVIIDNQQSDAKDSLEVIKLFDRVLSYPQEDADIVMMKAAYLTLKNAPLDSVNKVYEQAIAIEPDNSRARIALIQNIWKEEQYDKVISISRPAQEYNPEEMVFYYFEGFAQYMKKENDAALQTFKKGVAQIKPDSDPNIVSDFYAIMGDILHEKGLDKEAFEAYDSCLHWRPENLAALNNYAYYLSLSKNDLKKAEQMSYKTIKKEPANPTFLDTYAWILFLQERYEEANIYIDQAIKNDTTPSGVLFEHAGDIYYHVGKTAEALASWQQALKLGDKSATLKKKIELQKYIAE
ncbi:tetratricopeptide repeat protein [Prevotella intermedia]|uniref:tetratricopeptide repeat protein n=1 Tax=Prevotella intermedia TaxID=28131 RepID=UPI002002EA98|nr:tetratricopeptide repeat protein [Prevotella intermedia]MCK6143921.1 tetratricopeptide repeat protein [Prevotella intermedia]